MIKATNWISSIERSGAAWRLGASRPSAPTRIGFLPWSRIADLSATSQLQVICGIRTRHEVRRLSVVRRKRLLRLIDTPADFGELTFQLCSVRRTNWQEVDGRAEVSFRGLELAAGKAKAR